MTHRFFVYISSAVALGGTLLAACDADQPDDPAICELDDSADPVALEETPPLPGDTCAEPPNQRSVAIEAAFRQGQQASATQIAELTDPSTITVVMCGTGAPIPSDRAQACTAVFAGGQYLVFDTGDGAQRSMEDNGLPVADIDAVFLTHFHSDHMADLGETISRSWILGRRTELPVYGGATVERVVEGFNMVYTADELYRLAHHGEDVLAPDTLPAVAMRIDDPGTEGAVVYDVDGVVVKAYRVNHAPVAPSLGFRVEYRGSSVGISGDTVDTEGLRNLARGADVLVSEVMDRAFMLDTACAFERTGDARNAQLFRDVRTYHIALEDVAAVAAEAGVGQLVLTHMTPSLPQEQAESLFALPIAQIYDGTILVPADGDRVSVPVD